MRKHNIIILFVVSIVILIMAGIYIYRYTTNIIKENREIADLTNLYEKLEEVRLGMRSAIINQRDYTLTGDSVYISKYLGSKKTTIDQFQSLTSINTHNLLPNHTFDSINLLLNKNFQHLDQLILLGEAENFDNLEDYIDNYSSDIFREFSTLNKRVENTIESKFSRFRSETVLKAERLQLFLLSFYSLSVLTIFLCFYLIYKQNDLRLRLVRELRESNILKDKFFSIIAHDLRSPFASLINLSTMVSEPEIIDDKSLFEEAIKNIEDSSKKTFNLLNNLLEWANSQTGKLTVQKEWFDIHEEITEIIDVYAELIKEKQLKIIYTPRSVNIFADKNMIRTVLRNLVGNALKFVHNKGEVAIRINSAKNLDEIVIIDNGPGLSGDDIAKLFRLDENTKLIGDSANKGSGLGLILCREFVEKNGGQIYAKANTDKGCTFGFSIPKL